MLTEDQQKWAALSKAYDAEALVRDPDEIPVDEREEPAEEPAVDVLDEIESPPSFDNDQDEGEDEDGDEEPIHVPKHCADLYRSIQPSLDALEAKTHNAIHEIVVKRLESK